MKAMPRPFALTQNSIDAFKACPRRGYLRYIEGLVPRRMGPALALGAAFHKAIFSQNIFDGLKLLEHEFVCQTDSDADALKVQLTILRAMALGYMDRFPESQEAQSNVAFDVAIINPATGRSSRTFRLSGHADSVEATDDGKYIVMMGTSSHSTEHLDAGSAALQLYALGKSLGEEFAGVICRLARKPSLRQRQGEGIEAFCTRIACDYHARPEFYFAEQIIDADQFDSAGFELELWQFVKELLARDKAQGWYKNTARCGDWGGCPYMALCAGQPGAAKLYRHMEAGDAGLREPSLPASLIKTGRI